jgi:hypothetical protein
MLFSSKWNNAYVMNHLLAEQDCLDVNVMTTSSRGRTGPPVLYLFVESNAEEV